MFTYDIQYGGGPFDQYNQKGETDLNNFMQVFDSFPWLDEIEKANETEGCAPTLSVRNDMDNRNLWVSMAGDRNDQQYIVGYIFPKTKKKMFGLGSLVTKETMDMYDTKNKQLVKDAYKLYFDKKYEELETAMKQWKYS